jgi:hypothetical protein
MCPSAGTNSRTNSAGRTLGGDKTASVFDSSPGNTGASPAGSAGSGKWTSNGFVSPNASLPEVPSIPGAVSLNPNIQSGIFSPGKPQSILRIGIANITTGQFHVSF